MYDMKIDKPPDQGIVNLGTSMRRIYALKAVALNWTIKTGSVDSVSEFIKVNLTIQLGEFARL